MISLGVDIGGTGCKCVAFRDDGTQVALSYKEYELCPGTVNLPAEILEEAVFQVISHCTEQLEEKHEIAALTISSFGESFVALDEKGDVLTDILLYFGNTENDEFSEIVNHIGEGRFMEIARIFPDASYSLSKMLYTQKVVKKSVWKYLFIAGYLCYRLSGNAVTDISLACRSLLYDVKNRCWSKELLDACGISEGVLPDVLPAGSIVGTILREEAIRLGLPETVQIVIGAHDQIVNALGAGITEIGDAVDTSGTCECITPLFSDMPQSLEFPKNNFACIPYLEERGYVTYAYNISAGSVVRWYRDSLAEHLYHQAEDREITVYDLLNETCPKEPSQLMILPFLQGMGGTPDVDPAATGLIAGLTTQTRLPDIYRAVLEGITFEMRYNQEKLENSGVKLNRLYACGGGAKSLVWLQIKADILGCTIIPVKTEECGAMGSAILGLAAVTDKKIFEIARNFWQYGEPIRPNKEHQIIYKKRFEVYKCIRELYIQQKNLKKQI